MQNPLSAYLISPPHKFHTSKNTKKKRILQINGRSLVGYFMAEDQLQKCSPPFLAKEKLWQRKIKYWEL